MQKTSIFKFRNLLKLLWNRGRFSIFGESSHLLWSFFTFFLVASLIHRGHPDIIPLLWPLDWGAAFYESLALKRFFCTENLAVPIFLLYPCVSVLYSVQQSAHQKSYLYYIQIEYVTNVWDYNHNIYLLCLVALV